MPQKGLSGLRYQSRKLSSSDCKSPPEVHPLHISEFLSRGHQLAMEFHPQVKL